MCAQLDENIPADFQFASNSHRTSTITAGSTHCTNTQTHTHTHTLTLSLTCTRTHTHTHTNTHHKTGGECIINSSNGDSATGESSIGPCSIYPRQVIAIRMNDGWISSFHTFTGNVTIKGISFDSFIKGDRNSFVLRAVCSCPIVLDYAGSGRVFQWGHQKGRMLWTHCLHESRALHGNRIRRKQIKVRN